MRDALRVYIRHDPTSRVRRVLVPQSSGSSAEGKPGRKLNREPLSQPTTEQDNPTIIEPRLAAIRFSKRNPNDAWDRKNQLDAEDGLPVTTRDTTYLRNHKSSLVRYHKSLLVRYHKSSVIRYLQSSDVRYHQCGDPPHPVPHNPTITDPNSTAIRSSDSEPTVLFNSPHKTLDRENQLDAKDGLGMKDELDPSRGMGYMMSELAQYLGLSEEDRKRPEDRRRLGDWRRPEDRRRSKKLDGRITRVAFVPVGHQRPPSESRVERIEGDVRIQLVGFSPLAYRQMFRHHQREQSKSTN